MENLVIILIIAAAIVILILRLPKEKKNYLQKTYPGGRISSKS